MLLPLSLTVLSRVSFEMQVRSFPSLAVMGQVFFSVVESRMRLCFKVTRAVMFKTMQHRFNASLHDPQRHIVCALELDSDSHPGVLSSPVRLHEARPQMYIRNGRVNFN